MYEGLLSLMQMAKTCGVLEQLKKNNLPFISILTHPTMAGILASFAGVGDIIIAEPGALIGFTGPRVIKQTIKQDLPKGFQTSEFNLEHGLVDMVVHRKDLKNVITKLLDYLTPVKNDKNKAKSN
jgi:acetyl-CoA carboxylase carboxyl transferase subunit beta